MALPAVWIVAGAPGAGKSTAARALCAALDPVPALLDKDTLFDGLAGALLATAGRPHDEREGAWYDEHVKVHEYAAMTAAALEVRSAGCAVVLVAPFTTQIRRPERWADWVRELGGDPVRLLWVRCDPATLHDRIARRGRPKDLAKLDDFEAFVARVQPDRPPPVEHLTVDTGVTAAPVPDQLRQQLLLHRADVTRATRDRPGGGS